MLRNLTPNPCLRWEGEREELGGSLRPIPLAPFRDGKGEREPPRIWGNPTGRGLRAT
jgi:hypothetical protein